MATSSQSTPNVHAMKMNHYYLSYSHLPLLGIDVSKATFDAHLLLAQERSASHSFPNSPKGFAELQAWLDEFQAHSTYAGLEATGPYGHALLVFLHDQGHTACLLNARHVKDHARSQGRRVKTDRVDAAIIASYLRSAGPAPWQPPAPEFTELQALVRRRVQLLDSLQGERNRLQQLPAQIVQDSIQAHVNYLTAEVKRLDKAIAKHVLQHASLQRADALLRSIPTIGRLVSATLLGEVPGLCSFSRARDAAAFCGVTPTPEHSGTSVHHRGSLSKEGSALLRRMLYMAAINVVRRPSCALHKVYKAMVDRGMNKACALGALMHKLVRLAYGVLKHQTPFAPNLAKL